MLGASLVLISPCRNEAKYLRRTLDSVLQQSVLPRLWVIVDDGSTDETPQILAEFAAAHAWLRIVRRADRGVRAVGPGVIEAFYAGLATVDLEQFEFLCKLDLDLDLPPRYFELLLARMAQEPRLASCSGKAYVRRGARLVAENHGDETSLGMTKFYRCTAFAQIGGFVREVMWDGIDCHEARRLGWIVRSWDEPELRFEHLRPMGASQRGILAGRARHGFGQYYMGTGFFYLLASALWRVAEPPWGIGSCAVLWGWVRAAWQRTPRYGDAAFRQFLRTYQWLALWRGKRFATRKFELAGEACWRAPSAYRKIPLA